MDSKTPLEQAGERPEGAGPTDPVAIDDTEGHSISMIMGVNALSGRKSRERRPSAETEELRPITKPFPRMRDDRRR